MAYNINYLKYKNINHLKHVLLLAFIRQIMCTYKVKHCIFHFLIKKKERKKRSSLLSNLSLADFERKDTLYLRFGEENKRGNLVPLVKKRIRKGGRKTDVT
jgi:hypothetical protein